MNHTGWISPVERNSEQLALTARFAEQVGHFGTTGAEISLPDRVIFAELEKKHLGELLPRVWQVTGSCVGAGAAQAYARAMLGDVVHRGDNETVKLPFPWATYGVGREIAGMRRPGSGSFGAAQAKAVGPDIFGYLAYDDERVEQPRSRGGWLQWTREQELRWSHPSAWPLTRAELQQTSQQFGVHTVTRVISPGQWQQLLAQGYGVTLASMFGTRPRVRGDVLLGDWNDSWAHQMSSSGYWQHPQHGLLFLIDNQWGPTAHGDCPTLKPLGVQGSFWITEATAARICRSEVFGHSATGGFPGREINWSVGTFIDE